MIDMYGILSGSSPSYLNTMFRPVSSKYDMRDKKKLQLPKYKTVRYGKNSIKYQGAFQWNKIPIDFKQIASFNDFKCNIRSWNPICNCSCCILCKLKGGHFTPVGDTINHWLLESTQCRPGQCILQAGVYHCGTSITCIHSNHC